MNKNPIIPFVLIMILGFGVVFFMSIQGLNDSEEVAHEEEGTEEGATSEEFDPEAFAQQTCIGCHGNAFEGGGAGPALTGVGERLSVEEIKDILQNGKGNMPPGLVPADNLDAMAEWVSTIE
ncbi:cytochrome c550 [Jeotgalibacillus soli]|uniref:Cytochrome c domain-containing protein n=1 Tax=Jeotgalibacillus soli TaxID=889306 RepID=A0A0C2VIW6_9BACL|nr:cytochrome c [Jeotgalibacillus soli]KIL44431.1 hypothetical protein KP78_33950 [Jeotgalibacillus soli]